MSLCDLENVLKETGTSAIAASGGIDSLTLALVACRQNPGSQVFHALSPAVPKAATERVREFARHYGWHLCIVDAQEFSDKNYLQNPVNRCFYCKTCLYGKIASRTGLQILSGTNLDDLDDFRPGLQAAKSFGVRHPFVEAGIDKQTIRHLALELGLSDLSDLPAAPCLSSRITTGIPIRADDLRAIDRVEERIKKHLGNVTLRCRLSRQGYSLELDEPVFSRLAKEERVAVLSIANDEIGPAAGKIDIAPYVRGSAFIR